jgi:hypothetical protein
MDKVTIDREEYETLKRQAAAWREAVGEADDTVIFNAVRDNEGKGIPVGEFVRVLQKLETEDRG